MNETIGWKAASNGVGKRHWFVMHHGSERYYMNKERPTYLVRVL